MIAKLIVWGDDRAQALARWTLRSRRRASSAADERRLPAPRRRQPCVRGADLDTALIERERAALFEAPRCRRCSACSAASSRTRWRWSATNGSARRPLVGGRRPRRLHGVSQRRFDIEVGGGAPCVTLERAHSVAR